MSLPENTRIFSLELAQQGHPLITRAGAPAKFIAYVPENVATNQVVVSVNKLTQNNYPNGKYLQYDEDGGDLFLAPLGYCEGKPVFAGDKLIGPCGDITAEPYMTEKGAFGLAKWPNKVPVVETRMTDDEFFRYTANKAIERAIADGDVIPTSLFVELASKVFNGMLGGYSFKDYAEKVVLKDYLKGLKK